jgi:fibronectin-binding autotransporter adhesin
MRPGVREHHSMMGHVSGRSLWMLAFLACAGCDSAGPEPDGSMSEDAGAPCDPCELPAAPSDLIAAPGDGQVLLSWTASSDAASYAVLRSTTSGSGYAEITNVATTSYTDTGVENGTTYFYVVRALNAAGASDDSNEASATPAAATAVPAAPVDLVATPGDAQVSLSWSAAAGAASYTVRRSTTSGSGYADIATGVTSPAYTDSGAANGTTYFYVVQAVNAVGASPDSNEASATPVAATVVPAAPTNLVAIPGDSRVMLSWSASTGASTYTVRRSDVSGRMYRETMSGVTGTAFTDTTVTNGSTYYYVVEAVNSAGASGTSNEASATPVVPPPAPTNLVATAGNGQVSLAWTASAGATGYSVRRGTIAGSYTTIATDVPGPSYLDTTVTNETDYYYVVLAVAGGATSGSSNEATARPTALIQRVDSATFRTYASVNSSAGTVSAASCTTPNASCHAIDGNDAAGWSSGSSASPWLQVDSGNSGWGRHVDHFTIVYSTDNCSGGPFQVDYQPNGSTVWMPTPGVHGCVTNATTTLTVTLRQDAWAMSIRNNSATANLTVYEVEWWTTN